MSSTAPLAGAASPGQATAPEHVEIQLSGQLGEYALALLQEGWAGLEVVVEPLSTTVRGEVRDEDHLADLCRRIRDCGATLVGLRRTRTPEGARV